LIKDIDIAIYFKYIIIYQYLYLNIYTIYYIVFKN
jgi:hypothetical protein